MTPRLRMLREDRMHEATRTVEGFLIGSVIAAFVIIFLVRMSGGPPF